MTAKKAKINIKQGAGALESAKISSFWSKKTVEDLAKEQGFKPVKDLSELTGYWPEGADFDSFYEAAVNSRKHAE